ncbi:MAG TPA: hypothetical protein VMU84_11385 [Thermoanaerobaculia bacterium]|nr:hypothetical protein [Thermoanaerobaculia bacterium]
MTSSIAAQSGGLRDRDPNLQATKKIANDLQKASFHNGPFYLLSSIQLSDIGYEQEYFVPTDDHQGGLTLSIEAPQRFYFVPRKKSVYSIDFIPSVGIFDGGNTQRQFGYSLRGDAQYLFNHLYLDFYGATADRLRAFTGEINRVATQKQNEFGLAGEFKYSSKTSALFNVNYRTSDYPDDEYQPAGIPIDQLARNERNVRGAFQHKTFPRTSLRVAAEWSEYRFDNAPLKDSRREYVGFGANYDNGPFAASVEAGPARLSFRDANQKEYEGVLANLNMSRRLGSRWTASVEGARDVDFAIFIDNNYRVSTRGNLTLEFASTRKLTLRGSSTLEHDDYDVPVSGIRRHDDIRFNLIGWRYGLRRFRFGFDVGYYERTSNYVPGDQNGIRYIIHLSFTP